jgi:alkaline phosphatase D
MPLGLQAMLDYHPILPARTTPHRLYRSFRWGKHLEMFLLDNRQYRDANFEPEDPAASKTMLGREQVVWLKTKVKESDATWKLIVSGVPMSIPNGPAGPAANCDGWANYDTANGLELELLETCNRIASRMSCRSPPTCISRRWRYTPFVNDPDFQVHEAVVGPLNAGVPATGRRPDTRSRDLVPVGECADDVGGGEKAFNFGLVQISADGTLKASVTGIDGASMFDLLLTPR